MSSATIDSDANDSENAEPSEKCIQLNTRRLSSLSVILHSSTVSMYVPCTVKGMKRTVANSTTIKNEFLTSVYLLML